MNEYYVLEFDIDCQGTTVRENNFYKTFDCAKYFYFDFKMQPEKYRNIKLIKRIDEVIYD